jgi:hypothetical protein
MKPLRVVSLPSVPPQSAENEDITFANISAHSLIMPVLVLSDMSNFFYGVERRFHGPSPRPLQSQRSESQNQSPSTSRSEKGVMKSRLIKVYSYQHVIRKLEFYVAQVLATPIGIMESISDEALRWSQKVRTEGRSIIAGMTGRVERARASQRPLVEELG